MVYRALSAQPQAENDFNLFLDELRTALTDGRRDPNDVVRDTLCQIYFGSLEAFDPAATAASFSSLPPAARTLVHTLDPRNIATEAEYYSDIDAPAYLERKPFIWLWQMFD